MLTLFAIPRAFVGHIGVIQTNAIRSWTFLRPLPDIVLFGDEAGTPEVARELGLRHEPGVVRNEFGTPIVSDLFARAAVLGTHDLQCYVNADIILFSDLLDGVRRVEARWPQFLLVGRRWDLRIDDPLDFRPGWEQGLRTLATARGRLHAATGMDYFAYRRGLWPDMPPFAVGRTTWDNWLLYAARANGAPIVDATDAIMAIHQDHEYPAFPGGADEAWTSPEAARNLALAGGYGRVYSLADATWRLGRRWLLPAVTNYHRRIWVFPRRLAHRCLWRHRMRRQDVHP
jgi:hypothetical protein